MRVAFRVDASLVIGTGHVTRCLALAAHLAERGVACHFICRRLPGDMIDEVRRRGFAVVDLPATDAPIARAASGEVLRAEFDWAADAALTCEAIGRIGGCDWLVVDHYALDARWEALCADRVEQLMVIDDLADRPHSCDLLLDQNLPGDSARYDGLVPADATILAGPRFALLRPDFAVARNGLDRAGRASVETVFIFLGGIDLADFTSRALAAIDAVRDGRSFGVDVVVGRSNPHASAVAAWCDARDWVRFHHGSDQMAALMGTADVAIGAGGTTSWERCCLGLPSIVVSVAPNQRPGSAALGVEGAALYLGDADELDPAALQSALGLLIENEWARAHMAGAAARLVDGLGMRRVAGHLLASGIRLRRAGDEDCESLWRWRNSEETRRHSLDPSEIDLASHRRWFASVLASPDRDLLVGESDAEPIGVLRFDHAGPDTTISIYLVPGRAGRGEGTQLIRAGLRWLARERPGAATVVAEVRHENVASRHAFTAAGFEPYVGTYRYVLQGR